MSDPFQKNSSPNPANIFLTNNQANLTPNPQSNQQTTGNQIFQNNQNNNPSNPLSIGNAFTGNGPRPSGGTTIFNNNSGPSNTNSPNNQNVFLNNLNKQNAPATTGTAPNVFANQIQNTGNNIFQGKPGQNNQNAPQISQNINPTQTNTPANPTGSVNPLAILSKASGNNLLQAVSNPSSGPTLNLIPNQNNQTSNPPNNLFNKNNTNTQGTTLIQQNPPQQSNNQNIQESIKKVVEKYYRK